MSSDDKLQHSQCLASLLSKYHVPHLQLLVKHNINSIEKFISLAKTQDVQQHLQLLSKQQNNDGYNELKPIDLINFEHALNSLLKLQQTKDFLSKLHQLSRAQINTVDKNEWTLALIDCDDIESLLHQNKVTMDDIDNSINLLQASIHRLIENNNRNKNKNNEIFGYYLGGDLFALFINDTFNMDKSKEIVEYLIKIMQNKNKSCLTISVGIGIRKLLNETSLDGKNNELENKKSKVTKLEREWVVRAHANLLRSKENGKNCYFYKLVCVLKLINTSIMLLAQKKAHFLLLYIV